jgi:hypothetical protein
MQEWSVFEKILSVMLVFGLAMLISTVAMKRTKGAEKIEGDPVFPERDIFGVDQSAQDLPPSAAPSKSHTSILLIFFLVLFIVLLFLVKM